jgi:hypothetical protein
MAKTCTYSFTAPSGDKVVLTGMPAIKAWLASGGLEYLRGAANDTVVSRARDVTETPEFKRWFDDSKVVDASGKPLVVYHGTNAKFSVFMPEGGLGIYLTPVQRIAAATADSVSEAGGKPRVMELYASIKNPVTLSQDEIEWIGYDKARIRELEAAGHDGAWNESRTEILAFRPEQVKSAIGNTGAFATDNPDITRSAERKDDEVEIIRGRDLYFPKGNESGDFYEPLWLARSGDGPWAHGRTPEEARQNLAARRADITRSAERDYADNTNFKKWFGDSVMTDTGEPGGKPLRLYHGGFPLMDAPPGKGIPKSSARGSLGYGFYMTPDERRAETYAGESGGWGRPDGRVTALYARLQNPLVIEHADGRDPVITGLVATGMPRDKAIKKVEKANEEYGWTGKELMSAATKAGHDGLVFKRDGKISEVVVYQPTQVKSADGNDGSFSWNPDIRRSAEREEEADAVYKELAKDEKLIDALEVYMTSGDAPEGELNDKLLSYIRRLPPVSEDSYLTFYRNQPQGARPWARGWSSWTINEDQTRFFGGRNFEVLRRKGAQGLDLGRLGEQRTRDTGEFHQYGSQGEWLLLNESVFGEGAIRSTERPWYYSQLARAIEGVPARLDNQPGVMWAQWLKANASKLGVKQDEITWSGIEDFLKLKGKEKVSKEEIGAYLAEGGVRVEEVVLGDGGLTPAEITEVQELRDLYRRSEQGEDGVFDAGDFDRLQFLEERKGGDSLTKYGQYTLPGGTAYREVLLTLPERRPLTAAWRKAQELYGDDDQRTIDAKRAAKAEAGPGQSEKGYKSSHWDAKNVLAHVRLNDRVDAEGRRTLFVEELQSDAGADVRKKGFIDSYKLEDVQPTDGPLPGTFYYLKTPDNVFQILKSQHASEQAAREYIVREKKINSGGVPRMPFIDDTTKWLNLALKRVIAMAATEGYDAVAFVNGEQSAERYDLSKQVDRIYVTKLKGGGFEFTAYKDGRDIIPRRAVGTKSELAEAIGKDLADKADDQELDSGRSYTGLDLKIGGRGMVEFYDKIVPQAASALVKKMGGEGMTAVSIGAGPSPLEVLASYVQRFMTKKGALSDREIRDLLNVFANDQFPNDPILASNALVSMNEALMGWSADPKAEPDAFSAYSPKQAERNRYLVREIGRPKRLDTFLIRNQETGLYFAADGGWVGPSGSPALFDSDGAAEERLRQLRAELSDKKQPAFLITDSMRDKASGGMPLFSRERSDPLEITPSLERWARDVRDGKPADPVVRVSDYLPHASLRMAGLPKRPIVVSRYFASGHLRNSEHPEITPEVIGKLPAMLANPRIVIKDRAPNRAGEMVDRWQILAAERDNLNRPILVALSPEVQDQAGNNLRESDPRYQAGLSGRGAALAVVDMRTMFGREDSMNYVLRNLRQGNVVYMPDQEVAQLRRVVSAETPPAGRAGANPPARRAMAVSIAGDKALQLFESGNAKWPASKLTIDLPFIDADRYRDVVFSRERAVAGDLVSDIPNEDWLQDKVDYAKEKGRNRWGVPHMSTITGSFRGKLVDVPVDVLKTLPGQRQEQSNVRPESLEYIRENWDEVSQEPPYIEVAHNGEAWVSEGNHRIMVAAEKGLETLPVEIRYFDGGERQPGPLAPDRILGPRFSRERTETPEFKAWFKDSKVVDGDGKPLVVYHGTDKDFAAFNPANIGDNFGVDEEGFFFTDSKIRASGYADPASEFLAAGMSDPRQQDPKAGSNVMPVYLSIQRPLTLEAYTDAFYTNPAVEIDEQGISLTDYFDDNRKSIMDFVKRGAHDGVVFRHKGKTLVVALRPEQIKSAIGNDGSYDETDPNILSSAARSWETPGASKFDDAVQKFQDKNVDLLRVQQALKEAGVEIANDRDAYLREELFHGRAAKRTEDFTKRELEPLTKAMADRGLTIEELDEYLHARHAPEANRLIAERNPDSPLLQDGGSGLDTALAQQYMADLTADKKAHLEAVAAQVDKILAKTRKMMVDYELESSDTVKGWGEMFQHYVPLMREDDGDAPQRLGSGQGYSIKGREVKSRTGSTKKVVDILANIALQRERIIVRGEKNRVGQALVNLARENENKDFWTVDQTPTTPTYDPKKGVVVQRPDPMFKMRPNVLVAKFREEDGSVKEHAVIFNEQDSRAVRAAASLKNLEVARMEGFLGGAAAVTRYFSAIVTQYNPVFGIINFMRDFQAVMLNLKSTPLDGRQKEIAKDAMRAVSQIYSNLRTGKDTGDLQKLFDEFQSVGGQTGFRQLYADSADRADAIREAINPDAWTDTKLGKVFTANGVLKVPMAKAMRASKGLFQWLTDYNDTLENATRLAVYKAGKEQFIAEGMGETEAKEKAASIAKNISANFNRKGELGQQIGALYAFFNASMQGTARMGQLLFDMEPGKPKTIRLSRLGKRIVAGGVLLGVAQALALAAAGFSDDDPPEFVRERSLVIPTGGKSYISIPMPLGLHILPNIGRMTSEWAMSGFEKTPQRAVGFLGLLAEAFVPTGSSGLSMQTLAPTALDPLVALTENQDWQGRPIAKESMNPAVPGHALVKDTATAWSRVMAEAINYATGGNQYIRGAVSPTPDQIDYLISALGGGVANELSKAQQTATAAITGESLPTYKVPLVGRLIGNAASQQSEATAFYSTSRKLNELETEIKGLQKDGRFQEASALRASRPDAYLIAQANRAERDISALRKQKSELVKAGAPREQVRAIEERITARMAALNRAVDGMKAKAEI